LHQRLGRPLHPQQAQSEGIADAGIARRELDRTAQQGRRLDHALLVLEPQSDHIEKQRMLEAAIEGRLGSVAARA